MEEQTFIKVLLTGLIGFCLWLLKLVWGDQRKAIEDINKRLNSITDKVAQELKAIEDRTTELEKADIGVQLQLDSLKELKSQLDSLRTSILNLNGFVGRRND